VVFGAGGTDVWYRVVKTLDETSEAPQNIPYIAGVFAYSSSGNYKKSVVISNCYKFRIEFRKGGTTAGTYTPYVYMRKNGVSV